MGRLRTGFATGTLVGQEPKWVLTAAHNVTDEFGQLGKPSLSFTLAQTGDNGCAKPYGVHYVKQAWVSAGFIVENDKPESYFDVLEWKSHDWALLELENPIPDATTMAVNPAPPGQATKLEGLHAYSVGYPAGPSELRGWAIHVGGTSLVTNVKEIVDPYDNTRTSAWMQIEIDATNGQSGAPLYQYGNVRWLFGILGGSPTDLLCGPPIGAVLTESIWQSIVAIMGGEHEPMGTVRLDAYPDVPPDEPPDEQLCV